MSTWNTDYKIWSPADTLPVAAMNRDGRIEIFWSKKGNDNISHEVLHCWQNDLSDITSWTPPVILPGATGVPRGAETDATGRINLFWVDSLACLHIFIQAFANEHNNMFQTYYEPFSEPFHPGTRVGYLDIGKNSNKRLEPVYQGANKDLYHFWQLEDNERWSKEFPLGNDVQEVHVALDEFDEMNVLVRGNNDQDAMDSSCSHVYCRRRRSGDWRDNRQIARNIDEFAVARNQDGHLTAFYFTRFPIPYVGIWMSERHLNEKDWTTPKSLFNNAYTKLWPITDSQGRITLFFRGRKGQLLCFTQTTLNSADSYQGPEEVVDLAKISPGVMLEIQEVKPVIFHEGRVGVFIQYRGTSDSGILFKWRE